MQNAAITSCGRGVLRLFFVAIDVDVDDSWLEGAFEVDDGWLKGAFEGVFVAVGEGLRLSAGCIFGDAAADVEEAREDVSDDGAEAEGNE